MRFVCDIACVLGILVLVGCVKESTEPTYLVKGHVAYRHKPVSDGTVVFFHIGKPQASAPLSEDGAYEARLPEGDYSVAIMAAPEMPADLSPMEQFEYVPKRIQPFPPRYSEYEISNLSVTVGANDDNVQDFELR